MSLKAIFIYTDDRGRPVLRKIRRDGTRGNGSKDFRIEAALYKNDRIYWKAGKGCVERYQPDWASKVIYNLPVVTDALRIGQPTWIAEGERDSDTLMSVARVAATTTHQGIERMTPEQAEWFVHGKSPVNILMDGDDAGAFGGWARYTALIEAGVAAKRVQLWRPPSGFKDITEAALKTGLRRAVVRVARGPTRDAAIRYGVARAARYAQGGPLDDPSRR